MANIIFDFDGTIADDFVEIISIFQRMTQRNATLPPDEVERLRGMSLAGAAMELRVQPWKMPFLLARGRRVMRRRMGQIEVFGGLTQVIRQLHTDGHNLYIMSSNSTSNIQLFLQKHKLSTEFIKIYGGIGLLGKARVIRYAIRQNKLTRKDTVYIGDEVRDIEAAKLAGICIIAVTWGFNNKKVLAAHNPDYLALTPVDIPLSIRQLLQ